MVDVFRALDDETRRLVLDELASRDGRTLFDLCTTLVTMRGVTLTRQAISQHLGVLEAAGLIVTQRRGRLKLHYFNPAPLAEITRRWPINAATERNER
jgi:DNA-binding transcriptional ArsR family regulator